MSPALKLATYDDLLAYPEGEHVELHAGQIVAMTGPLPEHSRVQGGIARFIGGPFDGDIEGPEGWWILLEVDVRFTAHDVTRPDHAGWRRTRLPNPRGVRPIDVVPDWICEVLSPSNARHDRVYKQQLYARHGVRHYWLIDPFERTLEAYALREGQWSVVGSYDHTALARVPPFDAIELPVGRLFFPRPQP